jgi:Co/Zn/Cd efflux system component
LGTIASVAESCDCTPKDVTNASPAYRRALITVALANLAMAVVELGAGVAATSQSLKADALDFLGDGLITGLGIVAIGWSAVARTRAALVQGVFLATLGIGVLGTTAYRVLALGAPDAGTMGVVSMLAFAVNLGCAAILLPHRHGDVNVRAVWLFSRNDALGNAAVFVAAGLVALTGTPWPDLVVAAGIAGLFLHSAAWIVRDALQARRVPAGTLMGAESH